MGKRASERSNGLVSLKSMRFSPPDSVAVTRSFRRPRQELAGFPLSILETEKRRVRFRAVIDFSMEIRNWWFVALGRDLPAQNAGFELAGFHRCAGRAGDFVSAGDFDFELRGFALDDGDIARAAIRMSASLRKRAS